MADGSRQSSEPIPTATGLVVIRRLHRMVRHGFRPWLGYDVASGEDRTIHLRRAGNTAIIGPDGMVTFDVPIRIPPISTARQDLPESGLLVIAGQDEAIFDSAFPANTANRRNIVRRLYEIGIGAW